MSDSEKIRDLEARIAHAESQLAAQGARLGSIRDTAIALGSTLDMDELLALIMREVTRAMGAARSTLFLCDLEKREIWSKIAQEADVGEIRVPYGVGIAGQVAITGETVNINDAYADPRFSKEWDVRTGFRTRSVLCEPIRNSRGEIIGVIEVMNKEPGTFTSDDEMLLAALASQASISLENAKLYQAARQQNEELRTTQRKLERKMFELEFLFRVEQEMSGARHEADVLESVISQTSELLGAEAGSIVLSADRGNELFFRHATGLKGEAIKRFHLPLGQGIVGWVARTGIPILTNDPQNDPRHHWPIADALRFPARNLLCVPMTGDDRIMGAFELINKRGGDFTDDDLKMLTLVSGLVSKALQQARHREEQEKASRLADLGQTLSGVLHDFRTPMAAISGYVQLIAGDLRPEERTRYCETILRQFDHMSTMMREVLAFARGQSSVLFRKVQVHGFFQELEELLTPELTERGIEFKVDARYRGFARFDQGKMRRAIYNIARNAEEAMPSGGKFTIIVDRQAEDLILSFADTGAGIPEEIQDRLFESFVTSGKRDGTGLGLAIVKKIVDEHRGEIRFETIRGRGTTFYWRIPVDPDAAMPRTSVA